MIRGHNEAVPPKERDPGHTFIDAIELGDRVKAKRRSRGLSIREVAEETGVSAPTISRVERGLHLPERENLLRLAGWADVRIDPILRADARDRNAAVHEPTASTVEAVELHLRADPKLNRDDADALAEMFRLAYDVLSGGVRRGKERKE